MLKIVEKTKVWFALSLTIIIIGIGIFLTKGLNYGIDFTGGTLLDINMNKTVTAQDKNELNEILKSYTKKYSLRDINDKKEVEIVIQSGAVKDEQIAEIKNKIKTKFKLGDKYIVSEESISGLVGKELTKKAWIAIGIAFLAMLAYIGFRFEFKFGVAAILALIHDILITFSVYSILRIQVNSPFIAAILTILGYSINDTIVVFDRIRENMKKYGKIEINELVNKSINQTIKRSINTSISTLITICALLILVPSIREFTLPLTVGIAVGTYSSIFIASPMWVILKNRTGNKNIAKA
ncbi:protein translocase subunit SecF [Hathewaya histolytica]|uniref:Protein-export membrane protein SecF n=1 Tax=Hathewaya histolytica TaxID=1498 RepID=A0A4U9RM40_HATHI|nr:protein translocase subunit SecF [Hathewaya histolytica]VTQ92471.1 preprotein translocase subunit SecF [Hathewaya histolytica]